MSLIKCTRCDASVEGLSEPPYDNDLGRTVMMSTCELCWNAWVQQQLMLMNEYRLDPLNEEHSKFLDDQMVVFLKLQV
jgi:Fe-S cluster biosynthesis and repair protein YggX